MYLMDLIDWDWVRSHLIRCKGLFSTRDSVFAGVMKILRVFAFVVLASLVLPLLGILLVLQASFIVTLWLLDFLIPETLPTIAFGAGFGALLSGIGLVLTALILLARHLVNLILALRFVINIALVAVASGIYSILLFQCVRAAWSGPISSVSDICNFIKGCIALH